MFYLLSIWLLNHPRVLRPVKWLVRWVEQR